MSDNEENAESKNVDPRLINTVRSLKKNKTSTKSLDLVNLNSNDKEGKERKEGK